MHLVRRLLPVVVSLCMFALTGMPGWTLPSYAMGAGALLAEEDDQPK